MCGCKTMPTFGVVDAYDSRFFGGHVSENHGHDYPGRVNLIRHDPMRHEKGCEHAK